MKPTILMSAATAGLIFFVSSELRAEDLRGQIEEIVSQYLASHPEEVGEIVKRYFAQHPEALGEILADARVQRLPIAGKAAVPAIAAVPSRGPRGAGEASAAIISNATSLFSSLHQVTLGNPHGDITLVEFFDYNCGFCKGALPDMLTLLKDDPNLKVVLKEFPILGPGSTEAARVSVAVRMQDPGGLKYLAFHQELLGTTEPVGMEKALAVAQKLGLDMTQLERDIVSSEVDATLAESTTLAGAIGVQGTPGYVIGNDVIPGAVGAAALQAKLAAARGRPAN